MNVLQHSNLYQFLAALPRIKHNILEWRLVSLKLEEGATVNVFAVTKALWEMFKSNEGDILICNNREVLAIIRTGREEKPETLQNKIQSRLPGKGAITAVTETTKDGLQKIEMRLRAEKPHAPDELSLMGAERRRRNGNVLLVAEDDMFQRSLAIKALEAHGAVTGLESGDTVVDTYLKLAPDVLFLDIHLPGKSGLDILSEILMFDKDAYIVMLSADSGKDNVLAAKSAGAKGFVAKPFTREKLEDVLWKCPTMAAKK